VSRKILGRGKKPEIAQTPTLQQAQGWLERLDGRLFVASRVDSTGRRILGLLP